MQIYYIYKSNQLNKKAQAKEDYNINMEYFVNL